MIDTWIEDAVLQEIQEHVKLYRESTYRHRKIAANYYKVKGEEGSSISYESTHKVDDDGKHQDLGGSKNHINHNLGYP